MPLFSRRRPPARPAGNYFIPTVEAPLPYSVIVKEMFRDPRQIPRLLKSGRAPTRPAFYASSLLNGVVGNRGGRSCPPCPPCSNRANARTSRAKARTSRTNARTSRANARTSRANARTSRARPLTPNRRRNVR